MPRATLICSGTSSSWASACASLNRNTPSFLTRASRYFWTCALASSGVWSSSARAAAGRTLTRPSTSQRLVFTQRMRVLLRSAARIPRRAIAVTWFCRARGRGAGGWLLRAEQLERGEHQHRRVGADRALSVGRERGGVQRWQRGAGGDRGGVLLGLDGAAPDQDRRHPGGLAELAEVLGDHLGLALDDVGLAQPLRQRRLEPVGERGVVVRRVLGLRVRDLGLARRVRRCRLRPGDPGDAVEQLLAHG